MKDTGDLIKACHFDDITIGLREDGIIHVYIKSEAVVNRRMQDNIINSIISLKAGDSRKYPAIIEFGEFISISDDVILHTNLPFKDHILSIAVYAKNMADRILSRYYTQKYKTSSVFVIFNHFEGALKYSHEKMREANPVSRINKQACPGSCLTKLKHP